MIDSNVFEDNLKKKKNEFHLRQSMSFSKTLQFQPENFNNAQLQNLKNDFWFIVNDKVYPTNRVIADIISPKICKLHETDPSLSVYQMNITKKGKFERILEYFNNQAISLSSGEVIYFLSVFSEFRNSVECDNLFSDMIQPISDSNVFDRIQMKFELSLSYKEEVAYIARNFIELYECYYYSLISLDPSILNEIINHHDFQIIDEDFLFNCIIKLCSYSKKYFFLFENISFENISRRSMEEFVDHFDFNYINSQIWENICKRLLDQKYYSNPKSYPHNEYCTSQSCRISDSFGKANIFRLLNRKNGENNDLKNEITVTSSSINSEINSPWNVIFNNRHYFSSANSPNQWIKFDFKEKKVLIDYYILQTYTASAHLKSWVLEASNDGECFIQIDKQDNSTKLNGENIKCTFYTQQNEPYRYIRLRSTGPNWADTNNLIIQNIQFFGELLD